MENVKVSDMVDERNKKYKEKSVMTVSDVPPEKTDT